MIFLHAKYVSCLPSWHVFSRFPIISLWKLYVDMATICPIQLTTYATHMEFDHNWATDIRNILLQNVNG